MYLFFKLLPDEVHILDNLEEGKGIKYGVWLDKSMRGAYELNQSLKGQFYMDSPNDSFGFDGRISFIRKKGGRDKITKGFRVFTDQDKKQLAADVVENSECLVKTNSNSIIWNFNASGYLIDPHYVTRSGELSLPDGTTINIRNGKFELMRNRKWLELLGEDYKEFIGKNNGKQLTRLAVKSAFKAGIINLRRRNTGKIDDFDMTEKTLADDQKPYNPVSAHKNVINNLSKPGIKQANGRKVSRAKKNSKLAIQEWRCPLGDRCRYAKAGQICSHNREAFKLAAYFKTRDPDLLIESLTTMLTIESERYGNALIEEENDLRITNFASMIGNDLFRKTVELLKIVKPEFDAGKAINIFNTQINASEAIIKLEQAGMNDGQRENIAEEIGRILKEEKRKGIKGTPVASTKS